MYTKAVSYIAGVCMCEIALSHLNHRIFKLLCLKIVDMKIILDVKRHPSPITVCSQLLHVKHV